jgi:hypothetical protein
MRCYANGSCYTFGTPMEFTKAQIREAKVLMAACSDEELYDIFQEVIAKMRQILDKRAVPVEPFKQPVYNQPYIFNSYFKD